MDRHHNLLTLLDPAVRDARVITAGALTAALRFGSGTVTSLGFSSVPDVLASNPAVQGTDANRPTRVVSSGGAVTGDFNGTSQHLTWPVTTGGNNNSTSSWWLAGWFDLDSVTGLRAIWALASGSANDRLLLENSGSAVFADVYTSQGVSRRATVAGALALGKQFLTFEFNGAPAAEADRAVWTKAASPLVSAFTNSNGTPPGSTMPTALVASNGVSAFIGSQTAALRFLDGRIGPYLWIGTAMAGVTSGCLTPAARAGLMNLEAP